MYYISSVYTKSTFFRHFNHQWSDFVLNFRQSNKQNSGEIFGNFVAEQKQFLCEVLRRFADEKNLIFRSIQNRVVWNVKALSYI